MASSHFSGPLTQIEQRLISNSELLSPAQLRGAILIIGAFTK
jgi:hypothetical protein